MSSIYREIVNMAFVSELTARQICERANVKTSWYWRMLRGEFAEPGLNKMIALHEVLKKDRLEAKLRKKRILKYGMANH